MSSSANKDTLSRSNALSRLLNIARNEQPYDTSGFFSAGKQYNSDIIHSLTPFRFRLQAESSKNK